MLRRAIVVPSHLRLATRYLSSNLKTVTNLPVHFNLWKKIHEVEPELKPPVGNKLLAEDFIKVMIVGGPNKREDFHVTMGEEFFYQLKGAMHLDILHPQTKLPHRVTINEGEMFLLPGGVPHSPQRLANTIGLVFERERTLDEVDCMKWFHPVSAAEETENLQPRIAYEEYFHCSDLVVQLPPVIKRYQEYAEKQPKAASTTPSSSLSYYSNQDQIREKKVSIQELNDLFHSKKIEQSPLEIINIKERIQTELESLKLNYIKSGSTPHRYNSFFPIYQREFEFRVYTGFHQHLSTEHHAPTTNACNDDLPITLPFLNSAKEYLLYQYSGNSTIKKKFSPSTTVPPVTEAGAPDRGTTFQLKEGEMMIVQDLENNLQGLTVNFENQDETGVLWFIANNASVDCK
jgi:3-hydroxyanthranilate 3,4-dioxygenase